MKLSIETPAYNEKRYGKPYLGRLNPSDGTVSQWAEWIGAPGEEGFLELEVQVGDVVMKGQKDNRGSNSAPRYGVVQANGEIEYMSKAQAIKAGRAALQPPAQ